MLYNKQSTSYKSLLFPETASKKDNKKNSVVYYEKDLDDAGDNTKSIVNKAIVQGTKEAEKKKISESEKPVYLDNYIKAQVAADNNLQLYNNAVINMAKSELKSGISNPSSKKATESLATMESKYIPMTEYVKSKDESDYKKRLFTTTKYADPVYSDELKEYQKKLNQAGITDKFGDSIDEDGLWGAQTISAIKKLVDTGENTADIAKGVLEEFNNFMDKTSDVGKGVYTASKVSPTEIVDAAPLDKPNAKKRVDYDEAIEFAKLKINKKNINLHSSTPESVASTAKALKSANAALDVWGKRMGRIGTLYDFYQMGDALYDEGKLKVDKEAVSTIADTVGSWIGSYLGSKLGIKVGAKAGAKLGASVGSVVYPGVGTAIGGAIGGVLGGSLAAVCGGKCASLLSEKIYDEVVD